MLYASPPAQHLLRRRVVRARGGGSAASRALAARGGPKSQAAAPDDPLAAAAARLERATTERPVIDPELAERLGAMSPEEVAGRIFSAVDADRDGSVTRTELEDYLLSRDAWRKKEDVAVLFEALDADGDGNVTLAELRAGIDGAAGAGTPPLLWLMALAPPPAGVGVFEGLVREGGPVAIADAELRAMTLRQLKATYEHARRRCDAEGWVGLRFVDGVKRYVLVKPDDISLYDLATHVILPATYAHKLPDGTKPSFVELVADGPQRPDYFLSHYWGERHKHLIACVAQHTRDRAYGGGQFEGGGGAAADGDEAKLWVCAYANRQWSLAGDVTDDPRETSFHRAMSLARGTLALVDDQEAVYYTRWRATPGPEPES